MRVMFSNRSEPIEPVYMPDNKVCVDRSGFVPTNVQVDRILRSSKIAATVQRLKNANGSEQFIYDDMTEIENNYKDDLTLLAFAKRVKERLATSANAGAVATGPVKSDISEEIKVEPSTSESIEN